MILTIEIREGYGLRFRYPTADDMRSAWMTKAKLAQAEDETAVLDEISGQLTKLLVGSTDQAETVEELRTSGLLWGRTGVGLWFELYFRDLRAAGASNS